MRCIKYKTDHKEVIEELINRFPQAMQPLIRETIHNLALTRTSGLIASSLVMKILERWHKIDDPRRVEYGCKVYKDRRYYLQRKGEAYLLAIMLNANDQEMERCGSSPCPKYSSATVYNMDVFRTMETRRAT